MKTITNTCRILAILTILCLTTALGQDKKPKLSATDRREAAQAFKQGALSAATQEKLIKTVLLPKAPDKIVGKRFVFSGPLITLIKSDDPLLAFSPFTASNTASDRQWDSARLDPYLPPPRGITLFRLGF